MQNTNTAGSNKLFISVWVWLLVLTAFEVFLRYIHCRCYMLVILLGASIVKAALIVAYSCTCALSV
jgi:cytochrome c oxidase subunit IV